MAKRSPQTPGAAPADTAQNDQSAVIEGEGAGTTDLDVSDAQEAAKGKPEKGNGELTRDDYAKMRAKDVDAKSLKSSVLTLDGWVVPDLPPVAPVRA